MLMCPRYQAWPCVYATNIETVQYMDPNSYFTLSLTTLLDDHVKLYAFAVGTMKLMKHFFNTEC